MITISKLYYKNPWQRELETKIVSRKQQNGKELVVLQETIFYPTGGGQPHDLGTINGIKLLDVFEEGEVIFHVLAEPVEGDIASCVLDWSRRFDHMQQHSGQHLLSAVFADQYGYSTESFHLGEEYCSIDISTPELSAEEQRDVEKKVNEVILADLPLLTYTLNPEQLDEVPLRKHPDIAGPLRIVEINELDYSPCSGTHVDKTGQIGIVKIIRTEKYKGMTRVYFLCGGRAWQDYTSKLEICQSVSALLSVPEGELVERISLELKRKRELEKKLSELNLKLLEFEASNIVANQTSPFFLELIDASIEEAQQLARAILEQTTGAVAVNLGERIVLSHNLPEGVHLGQLVKEQGQALGGRGGGSATSAQIYFSESAQLQEFLSLLQKKIFK